MKMIVVKLKEIGISMVVDISLANIVLVFSVKGHVQRPASSLFRMF